MNGSVVQVFMLGAFKLVFEERVVDEDGWRRRKPRQLLKFLCGQAGRRAPKEELVELLWPESEPEAASTNLRTTLYALRQTLESLGKGLADRLLIVDRESIGLRPGGNIWIDADEFENLLRQAQLVADPLPVLRKADGLYVGDFLAGDVYEAWSSVRRDRLKERWTELQFKIARLSDEAGHIAAMERLLSVDASNERAAQELMQVLLEQGRRLDALRIYQRVTQALRDDLDVEPSESLVALRDRAQAADQPVPEPRARSFRPAYPLPVTENLVGRDADLQRMRRLLAQGKSAGAVAFVSGPAGMGKSALLSATIREAHAAGVLCLAGGSYEAGATVPLGPFHDALADYLLAQSAEQARAELGTGADDLSTVIPELRYHLELGPTQTLSPDRERVRQFGAVLSCLRGLCRRQPVLLCLEDLQAADAATLHLIHYLARQMRRLPLTLIATFRSEKAELTELLAQVVSAILQERLAERMLLGPLDSAGTQAAVTTLLGGEPSAELIQWLYRTSEGNPLFLEQLVFALKENDQLEWSDGAWRSVVDPGDVLPHIIRDVIQRRLEHLSPATREVLSVAAVLGRAFEYPTLLATLESEDEESVLASLEEALNAHLLQETPSGYAFVHTLLHQATYWSISSPRRMRLHARAGETLERLAGSRTNELCSELARHFARGGRAKAMRTKAVRYGLQAGRRAAALSAHREALQQYAELWPLVESDSDVEPATRTAVLEGRARAELQLARWDESIDTFSLLIDLTEDPLTQARAMGAIAYALHHTDRAAEAPEYVDEALRALGAIPPDPAVGALRLQLLLEKALHLFLEGKYRAQAGLGEQMLREAATLNDATPMSLAHTAAGIACMGLGDYERALEHFKHAREYAQHAQDKVRLAIALENLGLLQLRMGHLPTSREHFETALQLYSETSAVQMEGRPGSRAVMTLQGLARVSLAQERIEEAQSEAQTAASLARDANDRWAAESQFVLGSIHVHQAEWAEAERCFRESLAIRERVGHAAGIVESLVALGGVCEARHDWEAARQRYTRAMEVAARMDPSPWVVSASRHLGLLLLQHFDEQRGAELIRRAAAIAETMKWSVEYEPARAALQRVNQSQERVGQAP